MVQQSLSEDARERRDIHLNQIWKVAGENACQRLAQPWVVSADAEYAPPAQQVEILLASAVEEILSAPTTKTDVISNGPQHADHHFVHVLGMEGIAFCLTSGKQRDDIEVGL